MNSRWLRRYPPLVSIALALLIALFVLPSALTLPNSNPTTVLEYAPVPPERDEPPPPQTGSLSTLGLGTSSSLTTGAGPPAPDLPPPLPGGKGAKPITKRCVGRPLRETEDPNSPPCVPYFEGDNGGSTWQGVTRDDITVVVYQSGYLRTNGDVSPTNVYCDADAPPNSEPACFNQSSKQEDISDVKTARTLSKYFNERFQTYNRHVHVWVYFTGSGATPSSRRADAADNWTTLHPFAAIDRAFFGGANADYAEAMVRRNTSVYGNFTALPNSYYRKYQPFIWSFWPDVERWADMYVSYVCQKVVTTATAIHGGAGVEGKPRRYALMYTSDPQYPGLQYFAQLAKKGIQNCPTKPNIVEEVTFPRHQYRIDANASATTAARQNVAKMQAAGVTTVLWLGGYETQHSKAAAANGWFPEWVVAGDLLNDGIANARSQDQEAWRHAWMTSNELREDRFEDVPCRQAFREVNPTGTDFEESEACVSYRAFFQLFKSIQVAGPNLTPASVDQGQHSIQRAASANPYTAACFYEPGDYTCVKDAHEAWWDSNAADPDGDPEQRGCYRMVREGKRYLAGTWEGSDRDPFANPKDPCNNVTTDGFIGT
jgi:hypothetical protein